MLTAAIFVPLLGVALLALPPFSRARWARALGVVASAVSFVLLCLVWATGDPAGGFSHVTDVPWIDAVGAGYRVGVDGLSLPLALMSALLYAVAIAYPLGPKAEARPYVAWLLFLECVSLGFFLALDLLLLYVFFDLSLVGMYFLIALWGHEDRQRAALKFILYTLLGSLVMLLGLLSLALAHDPVTFDMRALIARQPLADAGLRAGLTLFAVLFGLAVKTPLVPVHTWLPAAHVEAPAPASTILAGVLLKMGTYGMIRIGWSMMREPFERGAWALAAFAVLSVVYGALVAMGQPHLKRRIAYTSITHMGYVVLGIALAAAAAPGAFEARRLALNGAVLEMVAHGLITGALFLIAGSIHQRGGSFAIDAYGGLVERAPKLTAAAIAASFASFGMPGFVGFVAELQIFSGAVAIEPWLAAFALVGVLITAALFLQLLRDVFFGALPERCRTFSDLGRAESASLSLLLGLTVLLGVAPALLLDRIDATARVLLGAP